MSEPDFRERGSYRVKRLYQTLRARVDEALAPLGLSMPQYGALTVLQAEGSLSNAALARLNFVTPQTMTRIVGSLQASELIERDLSNAGRSSQLKLSAQGQTTIEEAHTLVTKIEAQMLNALSSEELADFLQSLQRSADALMA